MALKSKIIVVYIGAGNDARYVNDLERNEPNFDKKNYEIHLFDALPNSKYPYFCDNVCGGSDNLCDIFMTRVPAEHLEYGLKLTRLDTNLFVFTRQNVTVFYHYNFDYETTSLPFQTCDILFIRGYYPTQIKKRLKFNKIYATEICFESFDDEENLQKEEKKQDYNNNRVLICDCCKECFDEECDLHHEFEEYHSFEECEDEYCKVHH